MELARVRNKIPQLRTQLCMGHVVPCTWNKICIGFFVGPCTAARIVEDQNFVTVTLVEFRDSLMKIMESVISGSIDHVWVTSYGRKSFCFVGMNYADKITDVIPREKIKE